MENKKDKTIEHLFESDILTFGDIRSIYESMLMCTPFNGDIYEKTDGQNLLFTYTKNDGVVFAKGNATKKINMNTDVLYSTKSHINESFIDVYKILNSAMQKLKDTDHYFNNGSVWVNCEIINPNTKNVIKYSNELYIQCHSFVTFVDNRRVEYRVGLNQFVENLNSIQIINDNVLQFKSQPSYECIKAVGLLHSKLNQLYKKYDLTDQSLIRDYYKKAFVQFVHKNITRNSDCVLHLTNRWGGYERKYRLDSKSITDPVVLKTAKQYDADAWKYSQELKDSLKDIFLFLGTLIMHNFENILCDDIVNSIQDLHNDHKNYSIKIESYLRMNLDANIKELYYKYCKIINNIGLDKYLPIEGIVFEYKNNQYKITNGLFTILNQLHGIVKYGNIN